jgi:light-regulated signal transduction histidine kinase (bacteriophytochrome)
MQRRVATRNDGVPRHFEDADKDDGRGVCLNIDSLHDLSSPANSLCSVSDLILARYQGKLDEEAEVLFGLIQQSAARLRNLLAGLKTYIETIETGRPSCRHSADALLALALASLQHKIEEADVAVTHDVLPDLDCDPNQITYMFASLIDNAIKFRGKERPRIHIGVASAGSRWIVSVCDNGLGIDPRHHKAIFGMFKRIYSYRYPGAGVGLAIAMRIVERHGGNIRVESVLGRGATVIIELPKTLETIGSSCFEERGVL